MSGFIIHGQVEILWMRLWAFYTILQFKKREDEREKGFLFSWIFHFLLKLCKMVREGSFIAARIFKYWKKYAIRFRWDFIVILHTTWNRTDILQNDLTFYKRRGERLQINGTTSATCQMLISKRKYFSIKPNIFHLSFDIFSKTYFIYKTFFLHFNKQLKIDSFFTIYVNFSFFVPLSILKFNFNSTVTIKNCSKNCKRVTWK